MSLLLFLLYQQQSKDPFKDTLRLLANNWYLMHQKVFYDPFMIHRLYCRSYSFDSIHLMSDVIDFLDFQLDDDIESLPVEILMVYYQG